MALDLSKSVFFISETKPELLPQSISEVAFVGRSNVGKSSFINTILINIYTSKINIDLK